MFDKKSLYFILLFVLLFIVLFYIKKENLNNKIDLKEKSDCDLVHGTLFCPMDPMKDSKGPCTCMI